MSTIQLFNDEIEKKIYKKYIWITPIAIISFILLTFLKSYTYCKSKFYFDLKYIPVIKFLMLVGLVGAIICSIASIISSFFKCVDRKAFYDINLFCKTYDKPTKDRYYDNYTIFFRDLWKEEEKIYNNIIYLFLFILRNINCFLTTFFTFLIIKNLRPEFYVIAISIYYFIIELLRFINFLIEGKYENFNLYDVLAEIFSFIGVAIYLELIELNFCYFYLLKINYINCN